MMSISLTSGIASVTERRFLLAFANHAPMITSWSNAPYRRRVLEKIANFIYSPFNHRELCVSPIKTDQTFCSLGLASSEPLGKESPRGASRSKRIYNVHHQNNIHTITAGTGVYSVDRLCPPCGLPNYNIFSCTFGIEDAFGNEAFI